MRAALKAGRKLLIGEKTIITPSARDLGEAREGVRSGRLAALTRHANCTDAALDAIVDHCESCCNC